MKTRSRLSLSSENIVAVILFAAAYLLPLFVSAYKINVFSYFMTSILLALSVSLIWGFTGIFSFGQAAFFGIGGYSYGIICKIINVNAFTPVSLLLAVLIAASIAAVLGYFMFYGGINDVFVGLITLCVTIALETFMGQTAGTKWQIMGVSLGGYNGLDSIPMIHVGSIKLGNIPFYIVSLSTVFLVYFILRKIQNSKLGYSLIAIRENRARSELFGYNVPKIQVSVFACGGAIAGLAGVMYSAWGNYITPSNMSLTASTLPVVLVAAGGRKNITAAVIFTAVYSFFSQKLSASGSQYALVILGLMLVLVILFMPQGIIATLFKKSDEFFKNISSKSVVKDKVNNSEAKKGGSLI